MIEFIIPLIFVTDVFPKATYTYKTGLKQKKLASLVNSIDTQLNTIEDYLTAANTIAVKYFENTNLVKPVWEYNSFDSDCGSHSTYTYAAYLSLIDKHNREDLQDNVRLAGGNYISETAKGHHIFLEKKIDNEWKIFEAVPSLKHVPAKYSPIYTFQLVNNESIVTSEKVLGFAKLSFYGVINF